MLHNANIVSPLLVTTIFKLMINCYQKWIQQPLKPTKRYPYCIIWKFWTLVPSQIPQFWSYSWTIRNMEIKFCDLEIPTVGISIWRHMLAKASKVVTENSDFILEKANFKMWYQGTVGRGGEKLQRRVSSNIQKRIHWRFHPLVRWSQWQQKVVENTGLSSMKPVWMHGKI